MHDGENWLPTAKLSEDKQTYVGPLQVWRCQDENDNFFKDVISLASEDAPIGSGIKKAVPLLGKWSWQAGNFKPISSPQEQREFVQRQLARFHNLDEYPIERSAELRDLQAKVATKMKKYNYPAHIKIVTS